MRSTINMEQMTMDVGQKHFGAIVCKTCGMVYTAAHPEDEANHNKYHRKHLSSVKFPGWKNERVLQEFDNGRIIMVLPTDPRQRIKKVEEISQLVEQELGLFQDAKLQEFSQVLLFITPEKKVAGCLVAEVISEGYRVISESSSTTSQGSSSPSPPDENQRAWCCQTDPEPAVCGISRIWVANPERRKHTATKLVDCVRKSFMFGSILPKASVAFSDPTPDGKMFATSYMGTPQFLVYKCSHTAS